MVRRLALLAVAGLLNSVVIVRAATDNSTINPRLGLLASSLGVPPVPGASYGGGDDVGTTYTGGEAVGTAYNVGGDYGPPVGPGPQPGPVPLKSCKCVPAKFCSNPVKPGGVVPPYGGGSQGGNGGNYGGNEGPIGGGNYGQGSVGGNGGNYGGNGGTVGGGDYGGNGGTIGGGNYGGGNGGTIGGGNYGGSNANAGANAGSGNYGGSNANAGANAGSGNYGGGLVEPSYPGTGGNGAAIGGGDHHGGQPGGSYGGPEGQGTDGAGVIDIRIVNRPPGGPVACLGGEVYCCDESGPGPYPGPGPNPGPGPYPGPGPSPIHGGQCGLRQIVPVPGAALEYGQAQFGAYPWMAVMLGPNNNYLGAGALIDSYHVLTAAHKIAEYKGGFKVRLGEWNAAADDEPYKNVELDVARVDVHPAYNAQNLQNDVALVTLAQPVSLDAYPHVKSVCLPQQGMQYVGQRCWVAGFGKDAFKVGKHSYILREVDVPIVESNECEQRLRETRLGSYFNLNRKSFLCAGGEEGKDACTGDGGSPLVCEYNGKYTVVGMVAWGIGCADYGIPGVYVNVPNYVNWIESKLETPYSSQQNVAPSY